MAQIGGKHSQAKPPHGFGSAGILETIEDHDGNTYRAIHKVQNARCVFVVGIATPKADMQLIEKRMRVAEQAAKEIKS